MAMSQMANGSGTAVRVTSPVVYRFATSHE